MMPGAPVPIILTSRADTLVTRTDASAIVTLVAAAAHRRAEGGALSRTPARNRAVALFCDAERARGLLLDPPSDVGS
jgi:hypothetical protein